MWNRIAIKVVRLVCSIKRLINRIFYNPYSSVKNKQGVIFGNSKLGKSFSLKCNFHNSSLRFVVGDECILYNQNIFESDQGRVEIGNRVFISADTKLISRCSIKIGNNVLISWGCTIYDHDGHSVDYRCRIDDHNNHLRGWANGNLLFNKDWSTVHSEPIIIGDNVWLGFDVVVLKGVTIGEGAIVGARSVVTSDVPPWTIVAGSPARVIREIPIELRRS